MKQTFKKIYGKTKDVCYEALLSLLWIIAAIIGAVLGLLYVITTVLITAPIATIIISYLTGKSFSKTYEDVYMASMELLYSVTFKESEETGS